MARLVDTSKLSGKQMAMFSDDEKHWIYNGFDNMLTREVLDKTKPLLDPHSSLIYDFERAMQGPALDMMLRGIKIDGHKRDELMTHLRAERNMVQGYFQELGGVFGFPTLNANSHTQLKKLFYSTLKLPEQTIFDRGEVRVSVNKEALETLEDYVRARPFVMAIRAIRDLVTQIGVLKSDVRNGRIYTSLNIGKETGRWSSSKSAFADGRGLQNIMKSLRSIFIPDKGMRMGYADLKQSESLNVAYLSGDENYIAAHLSGNVHEMVARMIFPEIKNPRETIMHGHWTYYDLCKNMGHATNYMVGPHTLSKHLKVPLYVAQEFQRLYFQTFPGIKQWQLDIASILQQTSTLTSPLGRRRTFFGRVSDETTIREAVAQDPQGMTADILNTGMYRVWKNVPDLQLLLPMHDAILFQYPENLTVRVCEAVINEMTMSIPVRGRVMTQTVDVEVGYNWMPFNKNPDKGPINLHGLTDWKSADVKRQQRSDTPASLLARRIS